MKLSIPTWDEKTIEDAARILLWDELIARLGEVGNDPQKIEEANRIFATKDVEELRRMLRDG